ncbi:MAG: ATP-binding cassette domain-containing protein [Spirochaetota bacterium]|nr:MAG: ATP-binding cassette domain-containing protein [Spirochaetota bacterium]
MEEYIKFKDVSKVFPLARRKKEVIRALSKIDLSIKKGEFVSIVGPSGSGKTTLLKLISGILRPTTGTVSIRGEAVHNLRRDTGNVFQKATLLPWRSVLKIVLLPVEVVKGEIKKSDLKRAYELLELLGLKGAESMYPSELSGGMQQRVAIARALILNPDILLLDEPFGALDSITRERLNRLLLKLWEQTHKTIVFVTHSISEAVLLSTRIIVLTGSPGSIKDTVVIKPEMKGKPGDIFSSNYISKTVVDVRRRLKDVWTDEISRDVKEVLEHREKRGFLRALLKHYEYLLIPFGILIFILLWGMIARIQHFPEFILPLPQTVFERFLLAAKTDIILPHLLVTAYESIAGFVLGSILAFLIGYVLAKYKTAERLLSPYIVAMQAIPIVALAPLLIIWFGFGVRTKILIAALVIFFPILISSIVGIRHADKEIMELLTSLDAGPFKTFFKFELPSALPMIFGGLKVGVTFSVIGAVVGEFLGSSMGLGALVNMARASFDTPLVFVSIILLGMLGIFFYLIMSLIEYIFLGRHRKKEA